MNGWDSAAQLEASWQRIQAMHLERIEALEAVIAAQREALQLADEFARQFLSFLDNEAPAEEWDGGEIGYSMGGLASMADDYQKARAALDAEGVSEPRTGVAPQETGSQPDTRGSLTSPVDHQFTRQEVGALIDAVAATVDREHRGNARLLHRLQEIYKVAPLTSPVDTAPRRLRKHGPQGWWYE